MQDTGSTSLMEGTVIAGKYRLERTLARGGMGSVWVARHIALDEPVAIKLITISKDELEDAEIRLHREAKSAARLRSPHVIQILDYGTEDGLPYIVMELLEGEHLGHRIQRKGRLTLAVAASITEQIAKALRRAHKAGIVHRDLKPANVFLARIDDEEMVKLLDFGIVKAVRGTLAANPTQANLLMGSPHYMSPEQTLGAKDIDHRTDLWSLGAILFEAITGEIAFTGDSLVNVLINIRLGPIPVPSKVFPDLPPEVDAFFERVFERDPGRRFPSARAFATEFSELVKRLGPRAERLGSLSTEDPNAIVTLAPSDIVEVITEITAPPGPLDADGKTAPPPHAITAVVPSTRGPEELARPQEAPRPAAEVSRGVVRTLESAGAPSARPPQKRGAKAPEPPKVVEPAPPPEPAGDRVAELIDRGFVALRNGDLSEARRCWKDALSLEPKNRALELNLRRLEAKKG